jgi:7-carboxy-7-deazaguanine synthase
MQVAEIFYSVQGEGRFIGVPSVFIRSSGCNLRCVWCDTPYTSWRPEGRAWSIDEIEREVAKYPTSHVVITGGEPLLAPDIEKLTAALKREGTHITIETAATIFKPVACDLVSMSPKLANSTPWAIEDGRFAAMHEQRRLAFDVIRRFLEAYDCQLKFVIEQPADFAEIRALLARLPRLDASRVLMMAQGTSAADVHAKAQWIVECCKTFGYSYTPRLHLDLYGNRRGT